MQATPAKGKTAKAAAEAEDPETSAALQKVAAAIAKLPKEPGSFSLMEKQEGGGYVQGGDSVPPPRHGSKVTSLCTYAEMSRILHHCKATTVMEHPASCSLAIQLLVEQSLQASGAVMPAAVLGTLAIVCQANFCRATKLSIKFVSVYITAADAVAQQIPRMFLCFLCLAPGLLAWSQACA